jgi:hypothetical protein
LRRALIDHRGESAKAVQTSSAVGPSTDPN